MITVFGDAVVSFVLDEDGRYHKEIRSYSYNLARALRRYGAYPTFICGLGKDPVGSFVVQDMVEQEIMFDPDLCILDANSAISVEEDGSGLKYFSSTAMSCVDEEKLTDALSVHSNIKCVHMSSFSLSFNPVGSSYLDLASFLFPRPFIFTDLLEAFDGPAFARHSSEAVAISNLVRCTEKTFSCAKDAGLAILSRNGEADILKKGEVVETVSVPGLIEDDFLLSAFILSSLEKEGFFQDDGVPVEVFDPGIERLRSILSSFDDGR